MKTMQESKKELYVKKQRVWYWEKFGIVPSTRDIMLSNNANMEVGI
jgi:hypothetical protein